MAVRALAAEVEGEVSAGRDVRVSAPPRSAGESCVRRSKRRPAAHACSTTRETKTHLYLRMWATWRLSVMNMRMKKYMTRMGQKTGTSKTGMHDATIENVTALVAEYLRAREK